MTFKIGDKVKFSNRLSGYEKFTAGPCIIATDEGLESYYRYRIVPEQEYWSIRDYSNHFYWQYTALALESEVTPWIETVSSPETVVDFNSLLDSFK